MQRLSSREIVVIRTLLKRGAQHLPISLRKWKRKFVTALWRRGLIDIWYRQSLDGPLQGPFYTLTIHGAYIAATFFPAPRGSSGAEENA